MCRSKRPDVEPHGVRWRARPVSPTLWTPQAVSPNTSQQSSPKSMQAYVRCQHCHRNQSRHFRSGRGNWTCKFCGELNPGPALVASVLVRRGKAAAPEEDGNRGLSSTSGAASPPPASSRPVRRVKRVQTPARASTSEAAGAANGEQGEPAPGATPSETAVSPRPAAPNARKPRRKAAPAPKPAAEPKRGGLLDVLGRVAYG